MAHKSSWYVLKTNLTKIEDEPPPYCNSSGIILRLINGLTPTRWEQRGRCKTHQPSVAGKLKPNNIGQRAGSREKKQDLFIAVSISSMQDTQQQPEELQSVLTAMVTGIYQDPLILPIAAVCMVSQLLLTLFFSKFAGEGPWKETAVFSAKQVIVIFMMLLQTYWGFVLFFDKITATESLEEGGLFMGQLVLGGLLQDIPSGILSGHVDAVMHAHHAGMFLVATLDMGYWSNGIPIMAQFGPFFFGVIELSSIPLAVVDMFHPKKQPEWYQYHLQHPSLVKLNEYSRYVFALLYMIMRMGYFPYVALGQVIPLGLQQLKEPKYENAKGPIISMLVFSGLFTLLQLYWGTLIMKQIQKALKGGRKNDSNKTKPKIKAV